MANSVLRPVIQSHNMFQRRTLDSHDLQLTTERRDTGAMNGNVSTDTLRRKSLKDIVRYVH